MLRKLTLLLHRVCKREKREKLPVQTLLQHFFTLSKTQMGQVQQQYIVGNDLLTYSTFLYCRHIFCKTIEYNRIFSLDFGEFFFAYINLPQLMSLVLKQSK